MWFLLVIVGFVAWLVYFDHVVGEIHMDIMEIRKELEQLKKNMENE